jgi:hypothetical protein
MTCEYVFILESEKRVEDLYKKLMEYYTHIDDPFIIVNKGFPHHIRLRKGSKFIQRGPTRKWKPTLDISLRREGNKSVALLDYKISGISDATEVREKASIEIEQFKLNYL